MDEKVEVIQIACLECGNMVPIKANGVEIQYGLNVFCPTGECEDRYAFKQ